MRNEMVHAGDTGGAGSKESWEERVNCRNQEHFKKFLLFYLLYPNVLRAIFTATSNVAESATVRGGQISIPLLLRSF